MGLESPETAIFQEFQQMRFRFTALIITTLILVMNCGSLRCQKIAGVNFESQVKKSTTNDLVSLNRINANWVAFTPWGFFSHNNPEILYECDHNWWGDTREGLRLNIRNAKKLGKKVLVKPHFWVLNGNWAGELTMNPRQWRVWQQNYEAHMILLAKFCEEEGVQMFCIGTELKSAVKRNSLYWKELIRKIRGVYSGKLIYAANWDNYHMISFWKELDYIGIDGYFPLVEGKSPSKTKIVARWTEIAQQLSVYSKEINRKIIFTEYGYRSTPGCVWKQWEIENRPSNKMVNLDVQVLAYQGFYEGVWNEGWLAGGFIWEWHPNDRTAGGSNNSNYTPQHKPVEKTIAKWYLKSR